MRVRSIQRALPRWGVAAGAGFIVGFASAGGAEDTERAALTHVGVAPLRTEAAETPSVGARDARDDPTEGGRACLWVTGPPCLLRAEKQSVCLMSAACPTGMKVVSGGCEGFTSVALGRSAPSADLSAWTCAASRLFTLPNMNEISARAFCCP
jgi:hypothetical protein